jgi:endonuclease/exonuclease/phosphatase family metal-dependent hydrolase
MTPISLTPRSEGAGMSSLVPRLVAVTHNVWGAERWARRQAAFDAFYRRRTPDLVCWQEYSPQPAAVLRTVRPELDHVVDATEQGAIWWDRQRFGLRERGGIGLPADTSGRMLFWVRLHDRAADRELVVSTAHLTWSGLDGERAGGPNPRLAQAAAIVQALDQVAEQPRPCLFMGDLNDAYHAVRTMREAGFLDSFGALGEVPQPTHPILPTAYTSPGWGPGFDPPLPVDWQLHRGPLEVEMTQVASGFHDEIAASDHAGVITAYRWVTGTAAPEASEGGA